MANQKHLTAEQRTIIQSMISEHSSFSSIGTFLNKDRSTISKEVKGHLVKTRTGYSYVNFNACIHRSSCTKLHVCEICKPDKRYKKCSNCSACNRNCPDFIQEHCTLLSKPPYVCNACTKKYKGCTLEKQFYYADQAQKDYIEKLSESRSGFSFTEDEIKSLDSIISPLIRQGQSPHHICSTNKDSIMVSESTIYRLIDASAFSARNIDLTRKVRFRVRKNPVHFKVDKACRIGRKYVDFCTFMKDFPDTPVTELDSVEGKKGGKVLLTIHFVKAEMMLAFIRERNDSQSVIDIFHHLYSVLGKDHFVSIFHICLADNGSEFPNPTAIEFDHDGFQRTRLFYCDPSAPYQKGSAEHNHEFIRRFIPKGEDMAPYSQADISLMMDHINSYTRESIGNKSPYDMFAFLYGQEVLDLLGCHRIPPQNVTLNRSIFNKEVQS